MLSLEQRVEDDLAEEEVKVDPMSLLLQMGGLADDKQEAPVPDALKTPSPQAPNGSCRRLGHDGDHATSQDRLRRASWPEEET